MNKKEVRKHIAIIHNMAKDYGLLDNEEISRTYQVIDYISNLQQENKQLKKQLSEYQIMIAKFKDLKSLIGILNERNLKYSFEEILK